MKTAGIIGLGLIGGSLAKALKRKCAYEKIIAYNRTEQPLQQALSEGVIDVATTKIDDQFRTCDIVFICTSVHTIASFVTALQPILKEDCLITDVASTKCNIVSAVGTLPNFIGGHPMAGSEKTGYAAAKYFLFENAYYVLTPGPAVCDAFVSRLRELIMQMGGIPIVLSPEAHDHVVAGISHVPHVIATALVNTISALDNPDMYLLAAGGFKDITRIASANPALWASITWDNRDEIQKNLKIFQKELQQFEQAMLTDYDALHMLFSRGKECRDSFTDVSTKNFVLHLDVEDKPGIIATVSAVLSAHNINIKNIGIINNREYENGVMQILFDNAEAMEISFVLLTEQGYTLYRRA